MQWSGQRPDHVPVVPIVHDDASKIIVKSISDIWSDSGDVEKQYGDTQTLRTSRFSFQFVESSERIAGKYAAVYSK